MNNELIENKPKSFFEKINTPFIQKVGNKIIEKSYLYPSFVLPIIIMLLVYACLGMFPVGDRTILILDMNGQYIYFFEQLRDVLSGNGSLLYTFERALGGEFFGIFTYYLASPLSCLVVLFPKESITEAVTAIMLLKCGLCGLSFAYYLDKTRKKNVLGFMMFGTMYALCAYATTFQSNTMWIDALIWLPLVALGIERVIRTGHFKLFVVALALTIWSNYYIGYMCCIFVALYFFCYLFSHSSDETNELNENLHWLKALGRIILYSAVAILIASLIILVAYYSLSFGKSEFQDSDFAPNLRFDIIDLVVKLFPGTYDTVRFEGHPNIYSGLLMLIMLPVYYFTNKISAREKIFYSLLCVIFLVSFSINTVDLVWHGFQIPIWLNYRYSFMFSFVMLTMAYRGFEHYKEMESKFFFKVCAVLIATLIVIQKTATFFRYVDGNLTEVMPDYEVIWLSIGFIAIYMVVLYFCKHTKLPQTLAVILLICVSLEGFAATLINWGEQIADVGWASRTNYRSFISRISIATDMVQKEDDSFYRMEKTIFRKPNDAFALNMRGASEFNSTFNQGVVSFLKKTGFVSRAQSSKYFSGNEVIDSILGIKYVIGDGHHEDGTPVDSVSGLYDKTYIKDGNMYIYKNPFALPIAYAVDDKIKDATVDNDIISPFDYMERLMGNMLGKETVSLFDSCKYNVYYTSNCKQVNGDVSTELRRTDSSKKASFVYSITAVEDGSIYMFLPTPYSTMATVSINDEFFADMFLNDSYRIYNIGNYKKGDTVKVKFEYNHYRMYFYNDYPYFVQVNEDNLKAVTDELKLGGFNVTKHSDTKLEGTLYADSDKTVLTTIPYDSGWKVYIDGERVETYKSVETFVGFDVTKGQHTIVMKYQPTIFYIGVCTSLSGVALFVVLIILDNRKRRLNLYAAKSEYVNSTIKSTRCKQSLLIGSISLGEENKKYILKPLNINENEEI
ncbi:MAG: YfhO family protein [Clostridia bacterium]|nr:YfhO family protein [Clostridia bacterium]